jgi:transposase
VDNLVSDELWASLAPYLPEHLPSAKGGRPRVPDRDCLRGIVFVLREGLRWQSLPKEMGCGSGSTCWRRFHEWSDHGVFHKAHCHLLAVLGERGLLNLERAVVDSASCRAQEGGEHTGPNPTDRGKKGCKRHLLTDGYGIPLVVTVGPANRRDETAMPVLLWLLYVVLGCLGGRRRPGAVQADRGYGFPWTMALVLAWGIKALIAPRGSEHGSGLGHTRFVVERTHAWFGHFRRLAQCYERKEGHFLGMQQLAACVICARRIRHGRQPAEEFQPFALAA